MSNKLYDAESMMQIKSTVAAGYTVLLNNGTTSPKNNGKKKKKSPKKNKKKDDGNSLAFMALTSGNVLDACFGVEQASRRDGDSPSKRKAQAAKILLDRSSTTESFQELAVSTYHKAFKIVIAHDEEMSKLNCFTRCFKAKKIRTDTEQKLKVNFARLAKAVGEKR